MKVLLGHKIGMTQIWSDSGRLIAATVIAAEPNAVIKVGETTLLGAAVAGKTNKAQAHLAKKVGSKRGTWVKQVSGLETDQDKVTVEQFAVGDAVKISGVTKGKGFAGVMKRHGFHGGPATHGGDNQRGPGSIGAQRPQRVPKGQKMPGHMGAVNFTSRGGKVLAINADDNVIIVSGAVPGPNKGQVVVQSQ